MRVFMFCNRMAVKVLLGTKHQTIRAHARCMPGDEVSLRRWSGRPYRSKNVIIGSGVCTEVMPVVIHAGRIDLNGRRLSYECALLFALADGFTCLREMLDWFSARYDLPFEADVVYWRDA